MSIGNVGQFPPLLSLPQQRCPTAATGTSSRLACMKDSPLFFSRSEDLGTQRFGPAVEYFLECLTNIGAHVIPIPRISETNGMSVVSGRRLTGFLAGLRRRIRVLCQPRSENCPGLPIFFGEAGLEPHASEPANDDVVAAKVT